MAKFERVLASASHTIDAPDCHCTAEMRLITVMPRSDGEAEVRIFRCPDCKHELRLTIWRDNATSA
jgi:hypothetical protein